jgi:protein phosphatase 1L
LISFQSAANYVESNLYSAISKRVEQLTSKSENNDFCEKSSEDDHKSDVENIDRQKLKECTYNTKSYSFLSKYKSEGLSVPTLSQIVTEEVLETDKQLIIEAKKKSDVAGSTALIALRIVEQNKLIVANVGDSRGVICDSKGSAIPLSFDHKPQQVL